MSDVLVSFVKGDRPWADWMSWVLNENGHTVRLHEIEVQAQRRAVQSLQGAMQSAALNREAIASLESAMDAASLTAFVFSDHWFKADEGVHIVLEPLLERVASSDARTIVPVRVEVCQPLGVLSTLRYLDLADQSEDEAERSLLTLFSSNPALHQHSGVDDSEPYRDGLRLKRRSHTVQSFTEPLVDGLGLEMTLVPGGTFLMGSPPDELERRDQEGPQHKVTVQSFFMGTYPITQEQWKAIASMPQVNRSLELDPSKFKGDNRPVETVSWDEAVEACDRLSAHTGRAYRLPNEAEWEYACRAGTTTPFHFGPTITTDYANFRGDGSFGSGSYGLGPTGEFRNETTAVGAFIIANAFGLCDMHDNVAEWCADHWHDNYEGAPFDGSPWLEDPLQNNLRVCRGGSWLGYPAHCRSASRDRYYPGNRYGSIGFRVVASTPRTL